MKKHAWWAALAAVVMLLVGLPSHAQVGNDGTKYTAATGTRLLGVRPDSTQKLLQADASGNLYSSIVNPEWLHYDQKATGITSLSLATGVTGRSLPVDLSGYSRAILHLTWDSADSSNVALGLTFYNKQSSAWGTDDTPVGVPFRQQGTNPAAAADTTGALAFIISGQSARPTVYVARSATAPVAGTFTLTALSRSELVVPGAAGVAIDLSRYQSAWNYWACQITNANGNTVDQIKATLWVAR